jgi:hypothetical protein
VFDGVDTLISAGVSTKLYVRQTLIIDMGNRLRANAPAVVMAPSTSTISFALAANSGCFFIYRVIFSGFTGRPRSWKSDCLLLAARSSSFLTMASISSGRTFL